MTSEISLSVIICNFNDQNYLCSLFNQIALQTLPPNEIIFVDDGSSDCSIDLVEAIRKKYEKLNIIIYKNEINRGTIYSANFAVTKAKSKYIYFAAADDLIKFNFFEETMSVLRSHPEAGLCSSIVFTTNENNLIIKSHPFSVKTSYGYFINASKCIEELIRVGPWTGGNSCIFRKSCYLECGGLNEEFKAYSDIFLGMFVSVKYGVCYIPENFTAFRVREGSFSSQLSSAEAIKIIKKISILMKKKYKKYFTGYLSNLYRDREITRIKLHKEYVILNKSIECYSMSLKNQNPLFYLWFLFARTFYIMHFILKLPLTNKNLFFVIKNFLRYKFDRLCNSLLKKNWDS
jgi:glycosyltransferase involved in cell wall biosynthesis